MADTHDSILNRELRDMRGWSYDPDTDKYSYTSGRSKSGMYKTYNNISGDLFKRAKSISPFWDNPDTYGALMLSGTGVSAKQISDAGGMAGIFDMMLKPQFSISDGVTAMKEGFKSGGVGGAIGALFSPEGSGVLKLGVGMLGGLFQGYTAKRDKEKAYAHKRKTEGRAPMGFNVFEDASPEDYLAGIPQKEQGIPNYYNPAKLPRHVSPASSPSQGLFAQRNQAISNPAGQGLLGGVKQQRAA